MDSHIKLGRILGIPIGLHWSWFLIFGLLTWSLAGGYFPEEYPSLTGPMAWALAVATSVLFFASVVLHELGHSVLALRNGIPVRQITLFVFGGVAQIERDPATPGAEFRIAIAGPLVSLALAIGFGALWLVDRALPELAAPSVWLARINLTLAVFNLIPGYPLDGGRVLRALVWGVTGNPRRAIQVATASGQLVAFGFMAMGIWIALGGNVLSGAWLAFIGWFLQNAAAASLAQSNLQHMLRGVRVGQVMAPSFPLVPGDTSLDQLVADFVVRGGGRGFIILDGDRVRGMLTLTDISAVPRAAWPNTAAEAVMVPWDRLKVTSPEAELLAALQVMDDANIHQLPVVTRERRLVGMISREEVLRYLRARAEVGL